MTNPNRCREEFEKWYVENVFDLKASPIGSRDCHLQWKAWQAATQATARRCVEICDQESFRPDAVRNIQDVAGIIQKEFGLQGE